MASLYNIPCEEITKSVSFSFFETIQPPFWKAVISLPLGKEQLIDDVDKSIVVVG